MSTRLEIFLVVVILAVAAVMRFLWLDVVPVGWHYDESLMGIMASEVYRGVQRPIFFVAFLGQEPIYIYLSAGMMWLMGGNQDILPLRTVSAIIGVATVGATYLLGRELFDRRVGLIGASLLAFSFCHVMLSRDGYRVITQPLLEALTIFLIWRATRQKSLWYYIAAGATLGGTIYTYLGARLFPGVLVLFALWWLVTHGLPPAPMRRRLGVFVLVAAAVVAPLAIYFATHPGTFSARIDQVSVFQAGATEWDILANLAANAVKLLATFTFHGDTLWRYNIGGRPIFVGVVAFLFWVGLAVAVWKAVRKQAASAMMVAWVVAMLFPSFLSNDVGGYTFRSMGLVPALFLFPALGFIALWETVAARASSSWRPRLGRVFNVLVVAILLMEAGVTYRDYFFVWANSFGAAYENAWDVVAAARYLDKEARPAEEDVFVSSDYFPQAVMAHLAPKVYSHARWFDGNSTLVFPATRAKPSLYIFPFSAMPKQLDRLFPPEAQVERSLFDSERVKFTAYRLTPSQVEGTVIRILGDPSFREASGNLGDTIELLAYQVGSRVEQGGKLGVTAVWRILKDAPSQDYVIFSHLLDHRSAMRAQYDSSAFPSAEWRAGDIVVGRYDMDVGESVAPGRYEVVVGAYDRATLNRIPVKGGPTPMQALPMGFVKVAGRQQDTSKASTPVAKRLGEAIELLGFDLQPQTQLAAPPRLQLNLYWQALAVPPEDYTVFVQVLNSAGRLVAQSDSQPVAGLFPTSFWEPGERIVDKHEVTLEGTLPPGRYSVIAGMYLLSSGERLPAEGGVDYIRLMELDVRP